jgi:putative ABC transport system ATP-binding protein
MSDDRRDMIALRGVSKSYRQGRHACVEAVAGVSLTVRAGEFVLIMGPSGSGKTTLLSMMGCIASPNSGHIAIDGVTVSELDQAALPRFRLHHIGFVFQSFRLLDALSVTENVEVPLNLAGVRRPESRRRAHELLHGLGLSSRTSFAPRALSGGERQRVAIARALANDPPVLLADEPTGNLDSAAGDLVIRLLHEQAVERGKAVVVVSHDTRIRQYADWVIPMEDGRMGEVQPTVGTSPQHQTRIEAGPLS